MSVTPRVTPRVAVRIERRPAPERPSELLWSPDALARWGVTLFASTVLLVGSWYAVSGTARYGDQVLGAAVGGGAVLLAAAAGASLVLKGRRAVGLRRVALLGEPPAPSASTSLVTTPAADTVLVGSDARLRYHRSDCPMVRGKGFPSGTRAQHESKGRLPCGVCRP